VGRPDSKATIINYVPMIREFLEFGLRSFLHCSRCRGKVNLVAAGPDRGELVDAVDPAAIAPAPKSSASDFSRATVVLLEHSHQTEIIEVLY